MANDARSYRGCTIEPYEGVQLGHRLPNSKNLCQRLGHRTHRKVKGRLITLPDGGTKVMDTIKAAREYIDRYLGPEEKQTDG